MKRILLPLSIIAAFVLAACGPSMAAPAPYGKYGAGGGAAPDVYIMPEAPAAPAMEQAADSLRASSVDAAAVERVVLKTADVSIVVDDVEARLQDIDAMAKEMGGFVVSSNLYQTMTMNYVEVPEASIVVRVPEERLDEALARIEADTVEVQNETRSGQDVTSTYVDLQSRLKNLEAAEVQLQEIMENATETEDVINVFNQLTSYREQIEVVKGQISYYDEAAALSSISVRIIAQETAQPLKIGSWTPKGAYLEAIRDLTQFLRGFVDFMIRFVIYLLPALILISIPFVLVFLGLRAIVRRLRRPRSTATETPKKTASR